MALRRRDVLILGGVGALAAAAGLFVGPLLLQSRTGAAALLSARLPDLSGKERRLSEWSGRVLVCNFWATWCPPCVEEIPLLNAAMARFSGRGVEIVGIAVDSAPNVARFIKQTPLAYPILIAGADGIDLLRGLGDRSGGLPFTVVLDRSGSIAETKLGAYRAAELEEILLRLTRV
jgi:peroxiredoxin